MFEQSLAAVNIARMLRPGGLFLSNNRIFELPSIPIGSIGFTDVTYMSLKGIGDTGDHTSGIGGSSVLIPDANVHSFLHSGRSL